MSTLTKKDLPKGTKVIPHTKTSPLGSNGLSSSMEWSNVSQNKKEDRFLYVIGYEGDSIILNSSNKSDRGGDYFSYTDVSLFEPKTDNYEIY